MKLLPFNLEEALKNPERVVRLEFPHRGVKEITRHGDIAIITWDAAPSPVGPIIYLPKYFDGYLRLKPMVEEFWFNYYGTSGSTQPRSCRETCERVGRFDRKCIYHITDDGETATIERIAV